MAITGLQCYQGKLWSVQVTCEPAEISAILACQSCPCVLCLSGTKWMGWPALCCCLSLGRAVSTRMSLLCLVTSEVEENERMGWRGWSLPVFLSQLFAGSSH